MNYKEQYINRMWQAIKEVDIKGSFPSVIIAQGALESSWGQSYLATQYNNYFGITKGSTWNGKIVQIGAYNYRVYDSIEASLQDRISVLSKSYPMALAATTPYEEILAIKSGGWAEATNYVSTLNNIIEQNNLTQFDNLIQNTMKATTTYSIFLIFGVLIAGFALYKLLNK